jgi:hypothetical protein
MFHGRFAQLGPSLHYTHDQIVTFDDRDPDSAQGLITSHAEVWRIGKAMVAAIRYEDGYRRDAGKWRFASRLLKFFYYLPVIEYAEGLGDRMRMRAYADRDRPTGRKVPAWETTRTLSWHAPTRRRKMYASRLDGKVALVTAERPNQRGTVRLLAANGASVVFTGSNQAAAHRIRAESGARFVKHHVDDARPVGSPSWKPFGAFTDDSTSRSQRRHACRRQQHRGPDARGLEQDRVGQFDRRDADVQTRNRAHEGEPRGPGGSIVLNSPSTEFRSRRRRGLKHDERRCGC